MHDRAASQVHDTVRPQAKQRGQLQASIGDPRPDEISMLLLSGDGRHDEQHRRLQEKIELGDEEIKDLMGVVKEVWPRAKIFRAPGESRQ